MKKIKLTQGKFAIVDDKDFEVLNQFKWFFNHGYAKRNSKIVNGKRFPIHMHREVLGLGRNKKQADHINGNKIDNRRMNLRICNNQENQYNRNKQINNTSGFKGVTWHKQHQKWYAQIIIDKKHMFLGLFDNILDAALIYNKFAIKYHGEFANLNII